MCRTFIESLQVSISLVKLTQLIRQHIDKADIHIKDRNGYTPLHTASEL